jgi:SWI/SNF-related matrix-associated actin-dependent regulator of chromatin subfamily A3
MEFNWYSSHNETNIGTPIVNTLIDLYAQLRFLRFGGGFSDQSIFDRLIIRPLRSGDGNAQRTLQTLMAEICLRRRKDMKFKEKPILELPGVDERLVKIGILIQRGNNVRFFKR